MNRKATFAKRQRESDLKDRARAKEARKAARKSEVRTTKGPEIAWDEAVYPTTSEDDAETTPPGDDTTATATDPPADTPATDDYSA